MTAIIENTSLEYEMIPDSIIHHSILTKAKNARFGLGRGIGSYVTNCIICKREFSQRYNINKIRYYKTCCNVCKDYYKQIKHRYYMHNLNHHGTLSFSEYIFYLVNKGIIINPRTTRSKKNRKNDTSEKKIKIKKEKRNNNERTLKELKIYTSLVRRNRLRERRREREILVKKIKTDRDEWIDYAFKSARKSFLKTKTIFFVLKPLIKRKRENRDELEEYLFNLASKHVPLNRPEIKCEKIKINWHVSKQKAIEITTDIFCEENGFKYWKYFSGFFIISSNDLNVLSSMNFLKPNDVQYFNTIFKYHIIFDLSIYFDVHTSINVVKRILEAIKNKKKFGIFEMKYSRCSTT